MATATHEPGAGCRAGGGGRARIGYDPWPWFRSRSSFAVHRPPRSTSESRMRRPGCMRADLPSRLLPSTPQSTITRPRRPSLVPAAFLGMPPASRTGDPAGAGSDQLAKISLSLSCSPSSSAVRRVSRRPKVSASSSLPSRCRWTAMVSAIGSTTQYSSTPCLP